MLNPLPGVRHMAYDIRTAQGTKLRAHHARCFRNKNMVRIPIRAAQEVFIVTGEPALFLRPSTP